MRPRRIRSAPTLWAGRWSFCSLQRSYDQTAWNRINRWMTTSSTSRVSYRQMAENSSFLAVQEFKILFTCGVEEAIFLDSICCKECHKCDALIVYHNSTTTSFGRQVFGRQVSAVVVTCPLWNEDRVFYLNLKRHCDIVIFRKVQWYDSQCKDDNSRVSRRNWASMIGTNSFVIRPFGSVVALPSLSTPT